jgi:hypothetical protein
MSPAIASTPFRFTCSERRLILKTRFHTTTWQLLTLN